jgi:cysteine synthase
MLAESAGPARYWVDETLQEVPVFRCRSHRRNAAGGTCPHHQRTGRPAARRARMMRALGAEVVTVAQLHDSRPGQVSGGDLELVEQAARRIALERKAFRADQFHHSGNVRARYLHTGPEILRQAGAPIDAFCDFAGTAGSFAGCAAALKEHHPATRCFIVEPEGCAVFGGRPRSQLQSSHSRRRLLHAGSAADPARACGRIYAGW